MDKASWIDAFVLRMTELGGTSRKLGELAERLWPYLGDSDPVKAIGLPTCSVAPALRPRRSPLKRALPIRAT